MSPPKPEMEKNSALQSGQNGKAHATWQFIGAMTFSLTSNDLEYRNHISADLSEQLAGA
jgi:hypothetical protein